MARIPFFLMEYTFFNNVYIFSIITILLTSLIYLLFTIITFNIRTVR